MHSYSVRDIERVLQLSRSTIRSLVDGGFVKPARGPRREYRFSFQDLVVLRAARTLIHAHVPARRIRRSLRDLRHRLPEAVPLSGLSICAVGDRVVVREGRSHWDVNDGQYLLGLDVSVDDGVLRVAEWQDAQKEPQVLKAPAASSAASAAAAPAAAPADADGWFERALASEDSDQRAALRAYQRAVGLDPGFVAAWTNWGRLLHQQGELQAAESVYRRALEQCGADALLLFNLGVLLEDQGRTGPAVDAYQRAIAEDPNLADCHYNLARLYEALDKPQHAIRHLGQYRRLVTSDTR
jgi:DNA-binding transcriptional MerR regulator